MPAGVMSFYYEFIIVHSAQSLDLQNDGCVINN